VITRYERVVFDRANVRVDGAVAQADLLAPGHPLLDAVVDLTVERHRSTLKQGTVLVDRDDPGETPRLLVALTQAITDGHQPPRTVSKRFEFAELGPDGTARAAGLAPYLDYEPPAPEESGAIAAAIEQPWLASGFEEVATGWAIEHTLAEHLHEVEQRVAPAVARTRTQVRQRLTAEINYWDTRHAELLDRAAAGRELRISPATAERRAREMERRLERREHDLESDAQLTPAAADGGWRRACHSPGFGRSLPGPPERTGRGLCARNQRGRATRGGRGARCRTGPRAGADRDATQQPRVRCPL